MEAVWCDDHCDHMGMQSTSKSILRYEASRDTLLYGKSKKKRRNTIDS